MNPPEFDRVNPHMVGGLNDRGSEDIRAPICYLANAVRQWFVSVFKTRATPPKAQAAAPKPTVLPPPALPAKWDI